MASVSVLIPYKPDHGPRCAAFAWIKQRFERLMPSFEICVGQHGGDPFSRSAAVNRAARAATGSIFVIADADIAFDPAVLAEACRLAAEGGWVLPYRRCLRLSERATARLLLQDPGLPVQAARDDIERISENLGHGALGVLSRRAFDAVGGMDERFRGWGGEDSAFAYALDTLCGRHRRIETDIYHLWHPEVPKERMQQPHYPANFQLYTKYLEAAGDADAMARLVREARAHRERRLTFTGRVFTGIGFDKGAVDAHGEELKRLTGVDFYPGTLNVFLPGGPRLVDGIRWSGWHDEQFLYPAEAYGHPIYIHRGTTEAVGYAHIMAAVSLRQALGLKDGDPFTFTIDRAYVDPASLPETLQ